MRIAYDIELRRPGCVLLQAVLAPDLDRRKFDSLFDSKTWLTSPTKNLKVYRVTDEELEKLALITKARSEEDGRGKKDLDESSGVRGRRAGLVPRRRVRLGSSDGKAQGRRRRRGT